MLKASDTKFRIGDDRLARWTEWQGRLRTRDLGAIVVSDERPMLLVAGEVLVGRNDRELIEECLSRGGELVPATTLLPAPPELLRTRRVESAIFPMPVRIRFPEPLRDERPEAVLTERLFKIRGRYPRDAGIRISDDKAASLASFVARHASQGRSIILNSVGEPCALTLSAPTESSNATEGADPTAWAAFQSPVRMVEAWHLVESVRAIREIESSGLGRDPGLRLLDGRGRGAVGWQWRDRVRFRPRGAIDQLDVRRKQRWWLELDPGC